MSEPREYIINVPASYKAMSSPPSSSLEASSPPREQYEYQSPPREQYEYQSPPDDRTYSYSYSAMPHEDDMVMVHTPAEDPTVLDTENITHYDRVGYETLQQYDHAGDYHETPVYPAPSTEHSDEDLRRNMGNTPRDQSPSLPSEEEMATVLKPFKKPFPVLLDPDIIRQSQPGSERSLRLGNLPDAKTLQSQQKPTKEMEVMQEAMTEGLVKYGIPISLAAVVGTFLMRRRYRQMKATPFESFVLSALHYYGAVSLGLYTGLTLYGPEFEAKVMEKIPDSTVAQAFKEAHKKK